jgi:tetratricopeptide (TPR) repeat protein
LANAAPRRSTFNGGQAYVYWEEAAQEFSLSYLALAFLPMVFLPWMALRERRWIAALTGIFISFTLILIFLLNPTADEQNRHLFKVFFTATHIFIALAAGLGVALIAGMLTTQNRILALGFAGFLLLLGILEIIQTFDIFKSTDFIIPKTAAVIGLSLVVLLFLCALARLIAPRSGRSVLLALGIGLILFLPVRPALSNWAVNEQRGHLFGYWYGHDMFSPPFDIYPEMDKHAILFGGTDPGRFAPTYMIFCESFMAAKYKRDKNFDRRDVYIITQNALADGTYLQYIRAHYNRSAQMDVDIFRNLAHKLDPDQAASRTDALKRRGSLYFLALLGLLVGAGMLVHASILRRKPENRRESLGAGLWGGTIILGALLLLPPLAQSMALKADEVFTGIGQTVEQSRRDRGVYPKNEIHTPSTLDNQIAFNDYLQDAMVRMGRGQLAHNENVTLNFPFQCPQCGTRHLVSINRNRLQLYRQMTAQGGLNCPNDNALMPTPPSPQMQVRGNGSVMAINALLTKVIFETNPAHSFYIEESFPLLWMYPYITPHGIIMKMEAEREFEITAITPAPLSLTNALVRLNLADELSMESEPDEDSFQPISPGTFLVSATHTNGMPSAIVVEDGGRFELAPPELLFVTGERTNVARIRVKMERIPNSAAYAISHAEIDSEMTGFNFQVNEVLQIFDSIITGSLQPKLNARLRVTEVNAQSGIARVEIIQGGRYVLMPPRHINLHAPDGTPLRMEIQTRRIPKHAELSEAILARDRKFWNEYSKRLIGDTISADMSVKAICQWIEKTHLRRDLTGYNGDPRFLRDQQAQKGFSKLRGSIGNIYAWRMRLSPAGSELRKRYAREAEHAYRQAFAFGPISPEAVIRYTALLGELGRYRDAVEVALTFQKLDPLFPQTNQMIAQALEAEIAIHAAAHEMDKALEAAQLLHQLVASPRYVNLVKSLEDALKARQIYLNRFQRDPANVEYFNIAVDVTVQSHQLDALRPLIKLFQSKMTRNERNLAALARAYNYLEDYANKEKVYQEMTALIPNDPVPWYDLAKAQIRLKKTNAAATSLMQSLTLYSKAGSTNLYNIPAFTRTNSIMAPLRERPEIQKLLNPEED